MYMYIFLDIVLLNSEEFNLFRTKWTLTHKFIHITVPYRFMFNFLHSNWKTFFISCQKYLIYTFYPLTSVRCQVTRIQMNPSFIFCFFIFLSNFISNLPELKAQVGFSVNNLFCRPPVCKFYYFQLLSRTIHQFRPILTQNIQVC